MECQSQLLKPGISLLAPILVLESSCGVPQQVSIQEQKHDKPWTKLRRITLDKAENNSQHFVLLGQRTCIRPPKLFGTLCSIECPFKQSVQHKTRITQTQHSLIIIYNGI